MRELTHIMIHKYSLYAAAIIVSCQNLQWLPTTFEVLKLLAGRFGQNLIFPCSILLAQVTLVLVIGWEHNKLGFKDNNVVSGFRQ